MKAMLFNPTLTGVSAVFTMMGGIGFAMYGGEPIPPIMVNTALTPVRVGLKSIAFIS